MPSYQYRKSHYGEKTILQPSYLHNGISYTGKTVSLYWIGPTVKMDSGSNNLAYWYDIFEMRCSHCLQNIYT